MKAKMGKPNMHETMGITIDSGETAKKSANQREEKAKYVSYFIIISLKEVYLTKNPKTGSY